MRMLILLFTIGIPAFCQNARVGTVDRRALTVAYYRSPHFAQILKAKTAERDAAVRAGDKVKAAELEKWGSGQQELAHRQLAGETGIGNILDHIAPFMRDICREAGVVAVVDNPAFAAADLVDVTDRVLDRMKADEKTRKVIRELPAR